MWHLACGIVVALLSRQTIHIYIYTYVFDYEGLLCKIDAVQSHARS